MGNPALQSEILNRLRTVKGHIAGIERMVEEEHPCRSILIQLSAVRASIEKIGIFVLENNAVECMLKDADPNLEDKEKVGQIVKQIISFLK